MATATSWTCFSRCASRSEEHTSELQSRPHLVCRLLLEKKKQTRLLGFPQLRLLWRFRRHMTLFSFFFNDTATTEIYTLSLHDALPISCFSRCASGVASRTHWFRPNSAPSSTSRRSEEHTSELQSRPHLVCRLLLE